MATISADLTEGFAVDITNGSHRWRADEPLDLGGTNTGPNPYEMMLGALAACTCITLSMYASRKEMKMDSISVKFSYEKVHAEDCEFCDDDAQGFIDTVSTEIFIEGDFTEAERKRLAEVAVRCPVHKTLERGLSFNEHIVVG